MPSSILYIIAVVGAFALIGVVISEIIAIHRAKVKGFRTVSTS
jgi:hypothetical protein